MEQYHNNGKFRMQRQEGEIAPNGPAMMVSILRPCEHVRVPNRRRGLGADEATMISALTFESNSLFAPSLYPTGAFVRETFPDDDDNGSLRISSSSSSHERASRRSLDNSSGNNSNMMLQGLLNKRAELEAVEAKQSLQKSNKTNNNNKKDPLSLFKENNKKGEKKKKDKTTKDSKLGMGPVEVLLVWLVRKIRKR